MGSAHIIAELKRDILGSVELLGRGDLRAVRRLARGSRLPGSGMVARLLAHRERRALAHLAGLSGVPTLQPLRDWEGLPAPSGRALRDGEVVLRDYLDGEPLHRARGLPVDFFDLLDTLVQDLHARGVCHNDLHKEQNILVRPSGHPALIDFQLASCHGRRGRVFRSRVQDDLRHVQKHRRRYTRDGRGPAGAVGVSGAGGASGAGAGLGRTGTSALWRRTGKPLYLFVTRRLLGTKDGEERRPSSGPWPEWLDPVGPPE